MQFGWWSVLPPLVAIGMAIATRRIVASLALGVLAGAVLLDPNWAALGSNPPAGASLVKMPVTVTAAFFEQHLWTSLSDSQHLRVFTFTLLMGAMIGVIHRSGGMHAVVNGLAPFASTRRGGQLITWVLGLVVFIDDYANSLLLGNTMRPLTDRLGISREKLAYVVDSTAAPVSGLALISTWVAGEIGYIEAGFASLDLEEAPSGLAVFIESIPYRFYVIWALLFVPLVAWFGRDFGPMLPAERDALRRLKEGRGLKDSSVFKDSMGSDPTSISNDPAALRDIPHRWWNAVVPILAALGATIGLLVVTGYSATDFSEGAESWWQDQIAILGNADSYVSLVYGSLSGLVTAVALALAQRLMSPEQIRTAAFDGAKLVLPSLAILWLAWALSGTTDENNLGTGQFIGGLLRDPQPPAWLPSPLAALIEQLLTPRWMPTIVFILASFVAFATGTSWGTMGILMPIVVATTYEMLTADSGAADPRHPLMIATIGSVLAGAIFGDHCSPISDTTVLSAQASGCDHLRHVRTQMPYAMLVAVVAVVCGTIPVGFGLPVWPILAVGVVVMALALLVIGRRV